MARLTQALAVVLPVALSLAVGGLLARPLPPGGPDLAITARIDAQLDARLPRLVVVGNSTARAAVDIEALGRALELGDDGVYVTLPGSSPATWYAALAHRVFARGHRPAVVVIAAPARSLWITRPVVGADAAAMAQIAGTEDPVLADALGSGWWARMTVRKRMWRAAVFDAVADVVTVGQDDDAHLDVLFAAGAGLKRPLAQLFGESAGQAPELPPDRVDDTLLPAILELVAAHDAELIVAQIPARSDEPSAFLARVGDAEEQVAGLLDPHPAATFLPMHGVSVPARDYEDRWHMNPDGAARYTAALVERLGP